MTYYASGRTTGTVVDCGASFTQVVSSFEGYIIPESFKKNKIAGNAVTEYWLDLLKDESKLQQTDSKFNIVNELKRCNVDKDG